MATVVMDGLTCFGLMFYWCLFVRADSQIERMLRFMLILNFLFISCAGICQQNKVYAALSRVRKTRTILKGECNVSRG